MSKSIVLEDRIFFDIDYEYLLSISNEKQSFYDLVQDEIDSQHYFMRDIEMKWRRGARFSNYDAIELFKAGYTNVLLKNENYRNEFSEFNFNIVLNKNLKIKSEIKVEGDANFIIRKENNITSAVVNGFVYDLKNKINTDGKGIVYK